MPFQIKSLERKMPLLLFEEFKDLSNYNRRLLAYLIMSRLYLNTFNDIPLSKSYIEKFGFRPSDFAAVKDELRQRNLILLTRQSDFSFHQCQYYTINPVIIRKIYPFSKFIYSSFNNSILGISKECHKVYVDDPVIKDYLKNIVFYWHGGNALDTLFSLSIDVRQKLWPHICYIPSKNNIHCTWTQQHDKGHRLYSSNPPLQKIPKVLRRPEIIGPDDIWEIDYSAQHLNILFTLNGKKPLKEPWKCFEDITGLSKAIVKSIINPMCEGQYRSQYIFNADYNPQSAINYDLVKKTVNDLGIVYFPEKLYLQTIGSKIFFKILFLLAKNNIDLRLPLHDGVILSGSQVDADKTVDAFLQASFEVTGYELPVNNKKVSFEISNNCYSIA